MKSKIKFEVETQRVLELLSSQIYDSPLAMLRENVQNAYDAILMRCTLEKKPLTEGKITINLEGSKLSITDNGIGMTEEVLRNNFWKAGSSGKHSELAERSGVIGTFGIGAMANFGVSSKLEVITRNVSEKTGYKSYVDRDELSISEECVTLEELDNVEIGSTIIASLDNVGLINQQSAINYLKAYVEYVPVEVTFNGSLISKGQFHAVAGDNLTISESVMNSGNYQASLKISKDSRSRIVVEVKDLKLSGQLINGNMILSQSGGQIMGYRNNFGLAPIPISSSFQLGGFINLDILKPTAGREALSRESISLIQQFILALEKEIATVVSATDLADSSSFFQNYIVRHNLFQLGGKVKIQTLPDNLQVELSGVRAKSEGRNIKYYAGRDNSIIEMFSSPSNLLLHLSNSNPRRQIQQKYITNTLRIPSVPDQVTLTKIYKGHELSLGEVALALRVSSILADNYFIPNADIRFADISHGVPYKITNSVSSLDIVLQKNSAITSPLVETYETARDVFGDFVQDYVRNQLYPQIKNYVPSSARGGIQSLRNTLKKQREIFSYEKTDLGRLEAILADILSGKTTLGSGIASARTVSRPQTQTVTRRQVGQIENAIPTVNSPNVPSAVPAIDLSQPRNAIVREDLSSDFKILSTSNNYPLLNGFQLFISLSDKLFKREKLFFKSAHTTKIIWAGHKVIYVFDNPTANMVLYYDIELKSPLEQNLTNGKLIPTTTIIMKNKIFVPVPEELNEYFKVEDGTKKFIVNYDTIP